MYDLRVKKRVEAGQGSGNGKGKEKTPIAVTGHHQVLKFKLAVLSSVIANFKFYYQVSLVLMAKKHVIVYTI